DVTLGAYGFELTYYNSETENLIQYGGMWPDDLYENLAGTSKFEGVEASYQRYVEAINTSVNIQFAQGTAKDADNQWIARRPEQTLALNLMYDGFNQFDIGLNTKYIGTTYDLADQQGAQIGEYLVSDLNINYLASDNVTLYANVLNLFNEDYTHAVAMYQGDFVTPQNVYSNGGTQLHLGIQGKL
ncbi:MAG: TonB-dependent receptor, partial [Pseudomonadota bacterium]|nr:TonB-dependent receptor [Pseudomonadota bacterium]